MIFSKDQLKTLLGEQITLSSDMQNALNQWEAMLHGKADWIEPEPDGVKSLHLENDICREFANVAISEMETTLQNEAMNELYQRALVSLNENLQTGLGLGSMVIKPVGDNVEYIPADRIVPIEFGDDGKLKRCIFVQVKPVGDDTVYYRLEMHSLEEQGLHITNQAYKGTKGDIGRQIQLEDIQEWADLMSDVLYPGMDRMDFGYYRNPLPNVIDGSSNGVSIFNSAIDTIRKADIQFGRLDWEYSSGERMVFADYQTVKKTPTNSGYRFKAPKGKDRLFVGVDNGDDDAWQEFTPAIRDGNYIQGLNEYKRQIEFNTSLAYGDLSKNETLEKTAQEIKSSKQRKYNMVNAIQTQLKQCLEDLAYAIAFYHAQYRTELGFECTFHDSILTDEETERQQDRIDMQSGVMSKVEYRMKWYGEDEATATEKIQSIQMELAAQTEGVIN